MPYNTSITRSNASPLIPEDVFDDIFSSVPQQSVVLRLARRLRDMTSGEARLHVLSALPDVYFVGEQGRSPQTFDEIKQTTSVGWENKYIRAEEMAVIVPIPQSVIDDSKYGIWEQVRPEIVEAISKKIDSAILFGVSGIDVPSTWPDGLLVGMPAAHKITLGGVGDLYDDIMSVGGVISRVEEDGFFVNGHIANLSMRAKLRSLREPNNGRPIFNSDMQEEISYSLDGSPLFFPRNGSLQNEALLISGDWLQVVWSVRQDVDFNVFTQGVITNNASPRQIQFNLMQDDMIALRVTFRMGWQLPNPVNRVNPNNNTRFPFAALVPSP